MRRYEAHVVGGGSEEPTLAALETLFLSRADPATRQQWRTALDRAFASEPSGVSANPAGGGGRSADPFAALDQAFAEVGAEDGAEEAGAGLADARPDDPSVADPFAALVRAGGGMRGCPGPFDQCARACRGADGWRVPAAVRHEGANRELYEKNRLTEALQVDLNIPDNSRSSVRTAVNWYRKYREATSDIAVQVEDDGRARLIGLERDLQAALRDCIEQLEPGLEIIDGGAERSVASGFIDITAKALDGAVVVIELKAGTARREAIGQVLSYMGDVADEEPGGVRGILVAGDFDNKARAAARVVPSLSLRRYRVAFEFSPPGDTAF